MQLNFTVETDELSNVQREALAKLIYPELSVIPTSRPIDKNACVMPPNIGEYKPNTEKKDAVITDQTDSKPTEKEDKPNNTTLRRSKRTTKKVVEDKAEPEKVPENEEKGANIEQKEDTRTITKDLDERVKIIKKSAPGEYDGQPHPTEKGFYWKEEVKDWLTNGKERPDVVAQGDSIISLRAIVQMMDSEQKKQAKEVLSKYGGGTFATLDPKDFGIVKEELQKIIDNG